MKILLIFLIFTFFGTALALRSRRGLVPGTGWSYYYPEEQQHSLIQTSQKVSGANVNKNFYENNYPHERFEAEERVSSPEIINREGYRIKSQQPQEPELSPLPQTSFSPIKDQYFTTPHVHYNFGTSKYICPQNNHADRKLFAYSSIHKQCFKIGSRGPCNTNMKFYLKSLGSEFGSCDCDPEIGYRCGRPLIYSLQDDWCYPVNSQGPCKSNQWLVLDTRGQPQCEPNICSYKQRLDNSNDSDCQHWVSIDGRCYETSTRNFCANYELLYWDVYNSRSTEPRCTPFLSPKPHLKGEFDYSRINNPDLPCLPGQKQTILRKCQPN